MPGRGAPQRSIRISDELWQAALTVAMRRGETVNSVVRQALERYVADNTQVRDEQVTE